MSANEVVINSGKGGATITVTWVGIVLALTAIHGMTVTGLTLLADFRYANREETMRRVGTLEVESRHQTQTLTEMRKDIGAMNEKLDELNRYLRARTP